MDVSTDAPLGADASITVAEDTSDSPQDAARFDLQNSIQALPAFNANRVGMRSVELRER